MAESAPELSTNNGADAAVAPRTNREGDDADLDELLQEDSADDGPPSEKPATTGPAPRRSFEGISTSHDTSGTGSVSCVDAKKDAKDAMEQEEIDPRQASVGGRSVSAVSAQPTEKSSRSEETPMEVPEVPEKEMVSNTAGSGTDEASSDKNTSVRGTSVSSTQEEDGGWGLSSVTAALGGGWGFAGGSGSTTALLASTFAADEEQQDDEWKHQAEAIEEKASAAVAAASSFFAGTSASGTTAESVAKAGSPQDEEWKKQADAVEHAVEDAAAAAAAAASSFFSGATEYLTGSSTAAATESETTTHSTDPTAAALRSLADLNPMSKIASGWIDDLEKQNAESDPHRKLRDHIDSHLRDWPKSSYEEWVEEALRVLEGWDDGSAVVDDTFYMEDSVHRNIWNERNAEEDDGMECVREYVSARKPHNVGSAGGSGCESSTGGSASSVTKSMPKTKNEKKMAAVSSSGDAEDADLAGLINEEEEIVFVDAPKSG